MADDLRAAVADARDAALAYARRGWAVVPGHVPRRGGGCSCRKGAECSSPGKHGRARRGVKDATTDAEEIRRRFRSDDSVIVATGAASGVWVLDVDGAAGEAAVRELLREHNADALPTTVTVRTGGGGWHYYFRLPDDVHMPNRTGLVDHVDVRGNGGGVVAPPSTHASGHYAWVRGRSPDEVAPAEAPQWLVDRILHRRQSDSSTDTVRSTSVSEPDARQGAVRSYTQRALETETARVLHAQEGTRHDTLFQASASLGELVGAGVLDRNEAAEALQRAGAGAGLPSNEIESTVRDGLDRGAASPRDLSAVGYDTGARGRRAPNAEALARRKKALTDDPAAVAWLRARRIDDRTIQAFDLGLAHQEDRSGATDTRRKRQPYRQALSMPLRRPTGAVNKFVHTSMPGVTIRPPASTWATGEPETHHAMPEGGQSAVIIARPQDMLAIWQLVRDTAWAPQVQIISSSRDRVPAEWAFFQFWESRSSIFVATPRGEEEAGTLVMRAAAQPVRRLLPPSEADSWLDYLAAGGTSGDLENALQAAAEVEEELSGAGDATAMGRLPYTPVDIARAYHRGCMYYPMRTLMRETHYADDGSAEVVEALETVVVRSDGRVLSAREMPSKPGTPPEARVWRLTDGTLIDEPPAPARNPSWSWASIEAWRERARNGESVARPLAELVREIRDMLNRSVWLPHDEDLTALAYMVAASYVQAVFKAVPYALVCGERGTGKSQLGVTLASLGANGQVIGQTSAASAARMMHEGRGLTVFDDLEGIGSRRGSDAGFTELIQWLKVSYNADTAKKVWTDSSAGYRVRQLNGFGIKIINNTLGADGILSSRMIRITTRKIPDPVARDRMSLDTPTPSEMQRLRDDLHVWAFENVQSVDAAYRAAVAPQNREAEIAAPLRVLANVADDEALGSELESALARSREIAASEATEPSDVVRAAAANLVRQGYYTLSPLAISMEARRLAGDAYGRTHQLDITDIDDPITVGRYLRSLDIVDTSAGIRRERVFGMQLRFSPVSQRFLDEVFGDQPRPHERERAGWCTVCERCPYAVLNCPIMQRRHGRK